MQKYKATILLNLHRLINLKKKKNSGISTTYLAGFNIKRVEVMHLKVMSRRTGEEKNVHVIFIY